MSPKELMYLEDALSHAKFLKTQCEQAAQALVDPELKNFVQQLANTHSQIFQQLYQVV